MAYQPKSYKKFVATAATATLVASAIVPVALANEATVAFTDVSAIYKDAVDYLVSENLSNGLTETEFGINANIKRGDAAIILAKALGIQDDAEAAPSGFSDVPTRASLAINSLKAAGVIKGKTATRFGFEDNLTRGEVALILANVKAYNYAGDVSKLKFTDVIGTRYASAVAGMVEAGITQGKTATSFGTGDAIKRGDFAIFIYKAEGSPALKANVDTLEINAEGNEFTLMFNRMIPADVDIKWLADNYSITINGNAATEAQLTALKLEVKSLSADGKTLVVTHTDLDELGLDGESVELSIGGAKDTYTFEVSTDAVLESVTAINTKALSLNLKEELASIEGLTFTVKRGTTAVVLTPSLSEDKKSIVLSSSTNLVAGEYNVTVTGGTFVEGSNTGTVTVGAQRIGKIEYTGDVLAKTGTGTATVGFKVFDQYGTDVTGSAPTLINNINWSANVAVDSLNDANGVLSIDLAGPTDFAANQTILITAVDSITGTSKSTNFTVGAMAAVKTLALGDLVLPKDTTRVYTGSASAATIPVIAKDQYGNDLDKASKLNGVTVLSSDSAVVPTIVDVDGKPVINLNTTSLTIAKSVTLTVVINATGETVTKTVEIVKPAQADVVTLGTLETNVVAANDAAKKFVLPITVVNQFGETLTAKQIASAGLSITGTGAFSGSALAIETDATSKNYGKIVNNAVIGAAGVGTIVVTSPTGKTASANYDVKAVRKVVEIAAPKSVKTNLVSGATTAVAYQFKDQYGDFVAASDNTDLKWKVTVTDLTGDTGVISANQTAGFNEATLNPVTVTAAAGKEGSAKVSAQLLNSSDEVLSQVETTFTVVANNAEGLTYAIEDVPTLFSTATGDIAVDGTNAYAAALSFSAKDANGNEFAIPASQILTVESVKGFFSVDEVGVDTASTNNFIDAQEGSYVIGAVDADDTTQPLAAAFGTGNTATDTLKVTFNTASGVKVITKDVTISKEALKAVEMKIVDKAIDAADPYALVTGTKDVTSLTFADRADAVSAAGVNDAAQNAVFVVTKDQYGVYSTVAKDFILNSVNLLTFGAGEKFSTTNAGVFTLADGSTDTQFTAGQAITFSVLEGNLTDTLTVKINAETPPTLTTALNGTTGVTSATPGTIAFSEELNAASKAAVEAKLVAGLTGTTADKVTFAWTGGTLTITNADTVNTAKFASATLKVKDLFNNESLDLAVVTTP